MVEDCWSKFAVPIQLKNCSATRKSNEHTKFLLKNANWALESKAETFRFATVRLPPNEAGNPCVLRPCFWDLVPPLRAVCVIDTKGTNSLTTCMFLSLFALWCWRLKVAYSKLIFGQRRAFRNKKEEPEVCEVPHTQNYLFLLTVRKMCDRQNCIRELSKSLLLHPRSHFCAACWPGISFRGLSAGNVVYTQRTTSLKSVCFWPFLGFFVRNEICLVRSLYMVK